MDKVNTASIAFSYEGFAKLLGLEGARIREIVVNPYRQGFSIILESAPEIVPKCMGMSLTEMTLEGRRPPGGEISKLLDFYDPGDLVAPQWEDGDLG